SKESLLWYIIQFRSIYKKHIAYTGIIKAIFLLRNDHVKKLSLYLYTRKWRPRFKNISLAIFKNFITMQNNYFVHDSAIVDDGAEIAAGVKIWHFSHIMPGCKIGENCTIGQNVVISPDVILGKNVKVQHNVSIYTGVTCDDDVFLGPSMVFTNVINPRSAINRRNQYARTHVGKGASIGANATIICGHDIGQYAF